MTRPPFPWRTTIWTKAALAVGLVALADFLLFDHDPGASLGLAALAGLTAALVAHPEARRDRRALAALAAAFGFALLLVDRPGLIALAIFSVALGVAVLSPRADRRNDVLEWILRFLRAGLLAVPAPLRDARRLAARGGRPGALRRVLVGAILPVVGGAMFLSLFVMANPLIEQVVAAWRLPPFSFPRLLFWAIALVLAWALMRPRGARGRLTLRGRGLAPGAASTSVVVSLVVFNALFALQNALDLAFLWSGAPLPEGVTFASYAHRGAYLLIVTALLAGGFVLVFLRPGSAQSRPVRALVIAWVAQNLMLVASSALRTLDYVEAYGLTQLRIAALAWMGLVGVGLVLIGVRLIREKSASWLIGANAAAMAAVLTAVATADIGSLAAAWNVRHAREVTGDRRDPSLDLCYLMRLGPAAVVPLARLEQSVAVPAVQDHVRSVRWQAMRSLADRQSAWRSWSWRGQRRLAAAEASLGPTAWIKPPTKGCAIVPPVRPAIPPPIEPAPLTPPAQAGS